MRSDLPLISKARSTLSPLFYSHILITIVELPILFTIAVSILFFIIILGLPITSRIILPPQSKLPCEPRCHSAQNIQSIHLGTLCLAQCVDCCTETTPAGAPSVVGGAGLWAMHPECFPWRLIALRRVFVCGPLGSFLPAIRLLVGARVGNVNYGNNSKCHHRAGRASCWGEAVGKRQICIVWCMMYYG